VSDADRLASARLSDVQAAFTQAGLLPTVVEGG
jgi:hypothetical protein